MGTWLAETARMLIVAVLVAAILFAADWQGSRIRERRR
jgi:hypothetical protein